ncbi:protein GLUTAMINE DUMPER 5-like [Curcuma longa]|uniref:protein GLUTAMINE DUMPER 5-like n=1 Tax=Curcuma longa TaxID=136217 RepID=UPI003D9DF58F
MRAGAVLNATAMAAPAADVDHSRWHSPVPYLFGGLAAMLGLVAFALLLLACSYWKLSRRLEEDVGGTEAERNTAAEEGAPQACYEEKVVVIMAGEETPTYLATPISSRASSFGDGGARKDEEKDCREVEQLSIQQRESQNLSV